MKCKKLTLGHLIAIVSLGIYAFSSNANAGILLNDITLNYSPDAIITFDFNEDVYNPNVDGSGSFTVNDDAYSMSFLVGGLLYDNSMIGFRSPLEISFNSIIDGDGMAYMGFYFEVNNPDPAITSFFVSTEMLGCEGSCNGIDDWRHETTHVTYDPGAKVGVTYSEISAVPLPGSFMLFASAIVGFGASQFKRNVKN